MKKFIFGLILGLLIPAVGAFCYFRLGYAPVATSAPPMPFEHQVAKMALAARIGKEAPKQAQGTTDEAGLEQGATIYTENCAFCHGLPGEPATKAAKGMFPLPPQLFNKDEMVTDDPVGETYWKVANGIRMTGMPGFGEMLTQAQIWQVSQLLAHADKLPEKARAALAKPAPPAPPAEVKPLAKPVSMPKKK
ncbi:MAG TPA: c-type cytochrome [Candidatus Angelobacter sp.]